MTTGSGLLLRRNFRCCWGLKFFMQSSLSSTTSAPWAFALYISPTICSTECPINGAQIIVVLFNKPKLPILTRYQKPTINCTKLYVGLYRKWKNWVIYREGKKIEWGLLSLIWIPTLPSFFFIKKKKKLQNR